LLPLCPGLQVQVLPLVEASLRFRTRCRYRRKIQTGQVHGSMAVSTGINGLQPLLERQIRPRRSTAPALQAFNPPAVDRGSALHASNSCHNTIKTSAALTNTQQSMSSLPSVGSVRKGGGIRATFLKMFGSKRRSDTFSTGANDHRSVGDTDLHARVHPRVLFEIEPS
jgi:hypothetical protein